MLKFATHINIRGGNFVTVELMCETNTRKSTAIIFVGNSEEQARKILLLKKKSDV